MADSIFIMLVGPEAEIVERYSAQTGGRSEDVVAQSLVDYDFIKRKQWEGYQVLLTKDGGETFEEVLFDFQPPRLPQSSGGLVGWLTKDKTFFYFFIMAGFMTAVLSWSGIIQIMLSRHPDEVVSFVYTASIIGWGILLFAAVAINIRKQRAKNKAQSATDQDS